MSPLLAQSRHGLLHRTCPLLGEIAKGSPPSVAAQRVGLKYPNAAAQVITKREKHPFEKVVDAIMEQDGVSRSVAMSRARKKEPVKFAAYQEA